MKPIVKSTTTSDAGGLYLAASTAAYFNSRYYIIPEKAGI
jgi:hypothetical protein